MSPPPEELRIVSLLPAATETLFALGLGPSVVARSHECDWPPAALDRPAVTRSRVDARASSAEIDRQVKQAQSEGHGLYEVDASAVADLRPTHVVAQELCEVCAVTPKDMEGVLAACDPEPEVLQLEANTFSALMDETMQLARRLGVKDRGLLLVMDQWRILKQVRARVRDLDKPTVALVDWVEPLMFAGNWMPELADVAGCRYELVKAGDASRWGSWDELAEADPDVVLVAPCGQDVSTTAREWSQAVEANKASGLRAVQEDRVWVAEGHHFFNRSGPRLAYAAVLLARAAHPELPSLAPELESQIQRIRGSKA